MGLGLGVAGAVVAAAAGTSGEAAAPLQKQIEALTAGLQKVSAKIEANKAAPQMASNNH